MPNIYQLNMAGHMLFDEVVQGKCSVANAFKAWERTSTAYTDTDAVILRKSRDFWPLRTQKTLCPHFELKMKQNRLLNGICVRMACEMM